MSNAASGPRYPIGTPEYDAYFTALRAELRKFVAGEKPYDVPVEQILGDPFVGTGLTPKTVFSGGTKYDLL